MWMQQNLGSTLVLENVRCQPLPLSLSPMVIPYGSSLPSAPSIRSKSELLLTKHPQHVSSVGKTQKYPATWFLPSRPFQSAGEVGHVHKWQQHKVWSESELYCF